MDPNSPGPRWGDGEPEDSPIKHNNPERLVFQFSVTQHPLDYLLINYGLLPTEDLRLTVATELHKQSSSWLDACVRQLAKAIISSG